MMAATIAAVAGIVGALGSTGLGIYGASQGGGGVGTKQIPAAGSQRSLRDIALRTMASNLTKTGPSFADFMKSGGTARFPLDAAKIKPQEAVNLGLTDLYGREIPYFDPTERKLNPKQSLFLGRVHARAGKSGPLAKFAKLEQEAYRLRRIATDPDAPAGLRAKAERRLGPAEKRFTDMLGKIESGKFREFLGKSALEQELDRVKEDSKDKSKVLGYLSGGGASKLLGY